MSNRVSILVDSLMKAPTKTDAAHIAAKLFKYVNTMDHANHIIALTKNRNTISSDIYYLYLDYCYKASEYDTMLQTVPKLVKSGFKILRGEAWENFTVLAMLNGDHRNALSIYQQIKPYERQVNTSFSLLEKIAPLDLVQGKQLLEEISKNGQSNRKMYNVMADAYARKATEGDYSKQEAVDEIEKLLATMKKGGIRATMVVYNSLLHVHRSMGNVSKCTDVLERMKADNVQPSTVTYGIIIRSFTSCCCTAPKGILLELYEESLKLVERPTVVYFNNMLHALSQSRDLESSLKVREDMKKAKIKADNITVNNFIKTFMANHQFDALVDLIKEVEDNGVVISQANYQAVVFAFGELGDFDSSYETLLMVRKTGFSLEATLENLLYSVGDEDKRKEQRPGGMRAKDWLIQILKWKNGGGEDAAQCKEIPEEVKLGGAKLIQALEEHILLKKKSLKVDTAWITILKGINNELK